MYKQRKLFSVLLIALLFMDMIVPTALAMAATPEDMTEALEAEEIVLETTEQNESSEEMFTDTEEQTFEYQENVLEATHPATQTEQEVLLEENEATAMTLAVQEEEVREAHEVSSGGNLIPVNITNTELKGNKDTYYNGDQIAIKMDWNITPGTTVQSGDYFEVSYPHFLNVANQTLTMDHGVCEPSNGVMTCTFDDRVNGQDNLSGGFEFGAQLKFQDGSGKHNETIYINGVSVGQVAVDAGDGSTGNTGGTTGRDLGKWGTRSMEDPSIINWTVELNGDLKYDMIYFTDTPGHGHHILPETVSVGINGQTVDYKNSQHVDSYSVTENSISMQLRTYRLDYSVQKYNATIYYSTKITDENVEGWSNSATMTPHGGQTESTSTFVEKFGGAWSQGELAKYRGSFTVVKTDEEGTPLQGATFNLKNNEGNVVQTFTTDENGQATIADIAGGHYTLVETKAPEGYVLNEEAMDIMLKFDQEKSFTKTVVNEKAEAPTCTDFTLIVKDGNKEDSNFVEGATVTKDGVVVGTTNENGELVMDPLTQGKSYEFVISKDGETKTVTIHGESDKCQFEVTLVPPAPKTCEFFTVTVVEEGDVETTIAGAEVVITDGNGETFATGTTETNGQFNTDKPLEVGTNYTVTVKVDGYDVVTKTVTGSAEDCGTKVSVTKTPEKNICENFTVNTEDGSTVTITDKETNEVISKGTVTDGTFVTENPLEPGKDYTVTVEKDGYEKETVEVKGSEENCEITVELTKVPAKNVCENYTVTVAEKQDVAETKLIKDAQIKIEDVATGEVFATGKTNENGQFVTGKPLTVDGTYKVIVEKDGYEKIEQTVKGSEEECGTTVYVQGQSPSVCTDFTVNTETGATVQITTASGEVFAEGTAENGKFITEKPLKKDIEYIVIVEKENYELTTTTVVNNVDCEITVELKEKPGTGEGGETPIDPEGPNMKVCTDFTVNTEAGATVQITTASGEVFAEGTAENGTFITEKPLEKGIEYTVTVKKDGYKSVTKTVVGAEETCETTITLEKSPSTGGGSVTPEEPETPVAQVCTDFTVNTETGATVQITTASGEVFAEGTAENGKFITEKPLEKGIEYTVTVKKDGYKSVTKTVVGAEETCETTITLEKSPSTGGGSVTPEEPETPVAPVCTDFTVNVTASNNQVLKGVKVTVLNVDTNESIVGKTDVTGKFIIDEPLKVGQTYVIKVQKADYKTLEQTVTIKKDQCATTLVMKKRPSGGGGGSVTPEEPETPVAQVCTDFTVNTEAGATVQITTASGEVFAEGTAENGKFITEKPLEKGIEYTVTVKKDGYKSVTKTVVGAEETCETTITLEKSPSTGGGTVTPEEPETPGTETPGTETPGTETPGTETPGTETPGTETPGTETPGTETPGTETPGTETPGIETPGTETPDVEVSTNGNEMNQEKLPQTGEEHYVMAIGLGIVFVLVGLKLTYRTRKQVL